MEEKKEPRGETASTELSKSKQETVELELFGKYLTSEYEILKRTLSYLNINDLISASYVTSSWKQACERLLQKRNDLRWHIRCKSGIIRNHDYKNKINFKSIFALGFETTKSENESLNELIEKDSYLCNSSVADDFRKGLNIPGVQHSNMLIVKSSKLEVPYYSEKNELLFLDNAEAGILFPDLEGFQIHVEPLFFDKAYDKVQMFSYPFLKGVLVLSTHGDFDLFEISFNQLCKHSSTPIAMAGGICDMVNRFSKEKGVLEREENLINMYFCGENVICHSDVLVHQMNRNHVENFMKKMKTEVGPYDSKKQRRIAIIFRCIARRYTEYEKSIFKQYFPDVPSFTLFTHGECGHHSSPITIGENAIKKKKWEHLPYSYSVAYFFVTLQLTA